MIYMKNFIEKHKKLIMEILRFLLVGGIATVIDFGIYELCRFLLFKGMNDTLNLVLATTFGFIFGNIVNYILSIIFVFKGAKEDKKTQTLGAFLVFTLIGVIGLGIKVGVQTGGNYLMGLMFETVTREKKATPMKNIPSVGVPPTKPPIPPINPQIERRLKKTLMVVLLLRQ